MDFYFILDFYLTKILSRSSNGDATNCSWVSDYCTCFVERLGNVYKTEFFLNVRRDPRTFCESFWKH